MEARSRAANFLIRYRPGVVQDLPLVSPYSQRIPNGSSTSSLTDEDVWTAFATDPFLSAKLCGVANSIFFNLEHRSVLTIQDALKRVGREYAVGLIKQAPRLDASSLSISRDYWTHCMRVALASRALAKCVSRFSIQPETAYLLGLMHDIGYLIEATYDIKMLEGAVRAIRRGEPDTSHATLGTSLLAFWSLPPVIRDALSGHHHLRRCSTSEGRVLAALMIVAEHAVEAEFHVTDAAAVDEPDYIEALAHLGLQTNEVRTELQHLPIADASKLLP